MKRIEMIVGVMAGALLALTLAVGVMPAIADDCTKCADFDVEGHLATCQPNPTSRECKINNEVVGTKNCPECVAAVPSHIASCDKARSVQGKCCTDTPKQVECKKSKCLVTWSGDPQNPTYTFTCAADSASCGTPPNFQYNVGDCVDCVQTQGSPLECPDGE